MASTEKMNTAFEEIDIDDLIINPKNDRHGELPNNASPIEWMLKNKGKEIRNLANDIIKEGQVFEPVLVEKTKDGTWKGLKGESIEKLFNEKKNGVLTARGLFDE